MRFTEARLKGAYIVDIDRRQDERGFFARIFCQKEFEELGLAVNMVQANAASNFHSGTVRGLHFQSPPSPEAKLVRCLSGAIFDVIVDLRPESPTWLQHEAVELRADDMRALYVPPRFAHGYQALRDDTTILYQASAFYTPAAEGGLRYNDPKLAVAWPLRVTMVSARDAGFALLDDVRDDLTRRMSLQQPAAAGAMVHA